MNYMRKEGEEGDGRESDGLQNFISSYSRVGYQTRAINQWFPKIASLLILVRIKWNSENGVGEWT